VRTLLLVAISAIGTTQALACSCANTTPEQVFDESQQAALVRIVAVEDVGAKAVRAAGDAYEPGRNYGVRATFVLLESFKGDSATLEALGTGYGGGDCGVNLAPGHAYLVNVRANGVVGACGIVREVNPTNCRWPALRDALHARARDGRTALHLPGYEELREGGVDCPSG